MIFAFRSSLALLLIGGFLCLSFRLEIVPQVVYIYTEWILCCLIMCTHASGISIALSLLIFSGWSLMWIASLTFRVHQYGPWSINVTSSERGLYQVALLCSKTADDCFCVSCKPCVLIVLIRSSIKLCIFFSLVQLNVLTFTNDLFANGNSIVGLSKTVVSFRKAFNFIVLFIVVASPLEENCANKKIVAKL